MIHVYTAKTQPATNWIDRNSEVEIRGGFKPDEILHPFCCGRPMLAKDCGVQVFYDGLYVWCDPGKGCKDPEYIAAIRAKEFHNRSTAQKARRERERLERMK